MLDYQQVELAFMNRDHAEFAALRDRLLTRLSPQAPATEVDALLDELLAHTRRHFDEENRLMQETGFPPYPMHKGEHERALDDMKTQAERWQQGRDAAALRDWLERAVGDWFVSHVGTMDFVTARFIKAQGRG